MKRDRFSRGVALITALFFGVLCMSMSVGLLLQVPKDLTGLAKQSQDLRASYVADAAIEDTKAWLSYTISSGAEPCTTSDPNPVRTGALGSWTWECVVVPDSGTFPNAVTNLRIYQLTATVSENGIPKYEIVADVQAGQSFARFSMFIDEDDPTLWDYAVSEHSRITGPVHKNRPNRLYVAPGFYSGPPPTETPFNGTFSTSQSANIWSSGGDPAANGNKFDYVFKNGQADLKFDVPEKPLPGDSSILANAAFGGTAPVSPPPGVQVNATGGIFIAGDVDNMQLTVNGAGNFELIIQQGPDVTRVVESTASDQRIVTNPDGSTYSVAGIGNGVIFSTGSINSLAGENKGKHTIAVDFEAGADIEITGSLTRDDTAAGSHPTVTDDSLGLIAEHVYIAPHSVLPRSVSTPLHVYATILATQRLEVKDRNSGPPGAMAIYGGLSSRTTWSVAQFSVPSMLIVTGYGGLTGYGTPELHYDELMVNDPPPEYPTTGDGEMSVRSWKERVL